eukprot:TRINITY_DN4995_c0_g1_i10.p1 TRINITY_DN4995_c0_g1~~TRINITY_DN4995_c0_g1_i10.p1  ORF type:complete len:210 (-),score=0.97 TRINITY_DN4995_c0_g1_i10:549-1178(-)
MDSSKICICSDQTFGIFRRMGIKVLFGQEFVPYPLCVGPKEENTFFLFSKLSDFDHYIISTRYLLFETLKKFAFLSLFSMVCGKFLVWYYKKGGQYFVAFFYMLQIMIGCNNSLQFNILLQFLFIFKGKIQNEHKVCWSQDNFVPVKQQCLFFYKSLLVSQWCLVAVQSMQLYDVQFVQSQFSQDTLYVCILYNLTRFCDRTSLDFQEG